MWFVFLCPFLKTYSQSARYLPFHIKVFDFTALKCLALKDK